MMDFHREMEEPGSVNGNEVDVCTSDVEENSRMSQGSQETIGSLSSHSGFADEEGASSSAVDLSIGSVSCTSSSSRVIPMLVARSTQPKLNRKRSRVNLDSPNDDNDSEDGDGASRKEKSLGLLCQRFLVTMGEEARSGSDVHLESVAKKMAVEKRRIYDIVNVMEALEAMSKTNKSFYRWHGLSDLPRLMHTLREQALAEDLPERINRVEQAMCSFTELTTPGSRKSGGDTVGSLVSSKCDLSEGGYFGGVVSSTSPLSENRQVGAAGSKPCGSSAVQLVRMSSSGLVDMRGHSARDRNGKNSLAQLCRRFLMVLLCNPKNKRRVSLDVASTVLIKDPESEGFEPPSRSRCRRLYDIANVLVAMGIIKKVHYLFGTKKIPLFVYSGPEPDANGRFDMTICFGRLLAPPGSSSPSSTAASAGVEPSEVPDRMVVPVKSSPPEASERCPTSVVPMKKKLERRCSEHLEVLVAASEKERLRLETKIAENSLTSSLPTLVNDENRPPPSPVSPKFSTSSGPQLSSTVLSAKSYRDVPVIRTASGTLLMRPKAQFASQSLLSGTSEFASRTADLSGSQSAARKYLMKVTGDGYQIQDPRQPHAFQKIDYSSQAQPSASFLQSAAAAATMRGFTSNLDSLQRTAIASSSSSYPPLGLPPAAAAAAAIASAYSVSAILGNPGGASNRATAPLYRIASPFQVIQPKVEQPSLERPRTVLGELPRSLYQN